MKDMLKIGSYEFGSRFFLGTGKYPSPEIAKQAVKVSEAEVLTFALRRVNFENPRESLLNYINLEDYTLLPNTAGANTAEEAVRLARMAREAGVCDLIKVEVIGDDKTLLPDPIETLKATEILSKEGFLCLPYCSDDLVLTKRLVDAGAVAVMPGGSPIGSGQGVVNPLNLKLIIEAVEVPVIVDAGLAVPSDAAKAMELGASGVLMNSAIAYANDPVLMAEAMKDAISAGRKAYLAGRIPRKLYAKASSPEEGIPV